MVAAAVCCRATVALTMRLLLRQWFAPPQLLLLLQAGLQLDCWLAPSRNFKKVSAQQQQGHIVYMTLESYLAGPTHGLQLCDFMLQCRRQDNKLSRYISKKTHATPNTCIQERRMQPMSVSCQYAASIACRVD
jgi:hypothetical protein